MDLAVGRGALGVGLAVAGLAVVAVLIAAFWFGARVTRREPPPPTPDEQPRLPEGGPVREVRENREPDEVPRSEHRLTPHQMPGFGNSASRRSPSEDRPRWDESSGGAGGH